jgi:uncharacterized membrane protein (DUF485 family)
MHTVRIDAPSSPPLKPAHQADATSRYWNDAVSSDAFAALTATKVRCIAPLLLLSFGFIIGMTLLAGYAKDFMAQKVFGAFNVGYLMILLTYLLCWLLSVIYVRTANRVFEVQSAEAIAALKGRTPQ